MELAASQAPRGIARRVLGAFWALNAILARVAQVAVVALVAVMVGAISLQVLTRALFNHSPPWTEEVALLAFGWTVLLMLALCTRERLHVRIDLLLKALPDPVEGVAERLVSALVAAIGAYLVWSGTGYLVEMRDATSQAMKYPSWLLYAAMPVAGSLLVCFSLEQMVRGAPAAREPGA